MVNIYEKHVDALNSHLWRLSGLTIHHPNGNKSKFLHYFFVRHKIKFWKSYKIMLHSNMMVPDMPGFTWPKGIKIIYEHVNYSFSLYDFNISIDRDNIVRFSTSNFNIIGSKFRRGLTLSFSYNTQKHLDDILYIFDSVGIYRHPRDYYL